MSDEIVLTDAEKKAIWTFGATGAFMCALKRMGKIITPPDAVCPIIDMRGLDGKEENRIEAS